MYSKISNMEKTHPGVEALRQILKDETGRFGKESYGHKVLHRKYQKTIIILTSVTTVVAGAGLVVPQYADSFIQFVVLGLTCTPALRVSSRATSKGWAICSARRGAGSGAGSASAPRACSRW